jgi:hypothetical protein
VFFRVLLNIFQREEVAQGLLKEQKESPSMTCNTATTGIRQRCLSWGVLLSFAVYMLSLCTLSPFVHADIVRQSRSGQQASTGHCTQPPGVAQRSSPLAADHEKTGEPLCCELRGELNKALPSSLTQADFLLLFMFFLPPFDSALVRVGMQSPHGIRAPHSSHPPPLYLVHATLLI